MPNTTTATAHAAPTPHDDRDTATDTTTALARIRAAIATPWILNTIRGLFILAVAVAVTTALITQWRDIRDYLFSLAWQSVVLSFAAVFAGMAANVLAWRTIVRQLDSPVTIPTAARITLIGNLAKYLPGSVWAYVAQIELGKRAGIPRARAFVTAVIALGLSTTASLVLGLLGLPALNHTENGRPFVYIVLALTPIALVCAHPTVLTRLIELTLKLLRKPPLGHTITWRTVLTATGWSTIAFICFGIHLWLLANAEATPGFEGLLRGTGAFSLAMTCGILVIIVPSGIGIRDAVLAAAFTPYVGFGTAIAIAAASRLVFTLADLLAAGAAATSAITTLRHNPPAAATTTEDD